MLQLSDLPSEALSHTLRFVSKALNVFKQVNKLFSQTTIIVLYGTYSETGPP
jgi:hypothetical protein